MGVNKILDIKIGEVNLNTSQVKKLLLQSPNIQDDVHIIGFKGPFEGKINTIFQIETQNYGNILIRCRTSKAFRYEPFIKEKVLYPLLDGSLDPFADNCHDMVKRLVENKRGSYEFAHPPIVPIQELLFWDETLQALPFPYAIKRMIPGQSLFEIMRVTPEKQLNSAPFLKIFQHAGQMLGKLHKIQFPAFYETVDQIGSPVSMDWPTLYWRQCTKELDEVKNYKEIHPILPKIEKILADGKSLMSKEVPVLFHNDFQAQNLIIQGSSKKEFHLAGVIDFDNWRIGPATQDFVKMQYWTTRDKGFLQDAFIQGYSKESSLPNNFLSLLSVYKLLWFILVFCFEMDKIKKYEQNLAVDSRFPAAQEYLSAIQTLVASFTK